MFSLGTDCDRWHVATVGLGLHIVLQETLLNLVGIGAGLVNLVDGHDERHICGLRMIDGFDGLGHHAVVCRHHQDGDVGDFGASGAHLGEGFVTRCIQENHLAHKAGVLVLYVHVVGADVLGDATGFARGHLGFADGIQQRGLAVVHVTHDGDHRRAGQLLTLHFVVFLGTDLHVFFEGDDVGQVAELARDFLGQFRIKRLVDGRENAPVEQLCHHILGGAIALFGKLLHGHAFGEHHDADFFFHVLGGDHLRARAGLAQLEIHLLLHFGVALFLFATYMSATTGTLLAVGINGTCGGQTGTAIGTARAAWTAWTARTVAAGARTARPAIEASRSTRAGTARSAIGTTGTAAGTTTRAT